MSSQTKLIRTTKTCCFRRSKCFPLYIPPTRVHHLPSKLTLAWTTSTILDSLRLACHISKGMKLFSQHIPGKANLEVSLSRTQSTGKINSRTWLRVKNLYFVQHFPPKLVSSLDTLPNRHAGCRSSFASHALPPLALFGCVFSFEDEWCKEWGSAANDHKDPDLEWTSKVRGNLS